MTKAEPAFPVTLVVGARGKAGPIHHQFPGLSLRDYFAAKAMQSLFCADTDNGRFRDVPSCARTAELAYAMADSMLAVRGGDGGTE